jgi:hypothetical protein
VLRAFDAGMKTIFGHVNQSLMVIAMAKRIRGTAFEINSKRGEMAN